MRVPLAIALVGAGLAPASLARPLHPPAPARPVADLFVDANASCPIADGSQAAPYCSISQALENASSGDVLRIAAGTYSETIEVDLDVSLIGVSGAAQTIVDAGGVGRVVTVEPQATALLQGLTITGGGEGGVRNLGTLTILACRVEGNTAAGLDGVAGIAQEAGSGPLLVEATTVTGNDAPQFGGGAGLGSDFGGHVTIRDSTFDANQARERGILEFFSADATIEASTISNNTTFANLDGGVLSCFDGTIEIVNSTIDGNTGAAIESFGTDFFVRSSTITRNTSQSGAGGLNAAGGTTVLTSSIVAANFGFATSRDLLGAVQSTGHNIIGDGTGVPGLLATDLRGTATLPLDPLLGPLQHNGGPTRTRAPFSGSPAVDAGDPANTEPFDQRGAPRTPGEGDIGAVERSVAILGSPIPGCAVALNDEGTTGRLIASGSLQVAANDLRLTAFSVPVQQFGFFLASRSPGFAPGTFGASNGNLCLSGTIGRFNRPGEIQLSGPSGLFALDVDLGSVPNGAVTASVQSGETWYFQAWHRELGGLASNFTEGRAVTFQ